MAIGFQSSAFQNNAFQVDTGATPAVVTPPQVGGSGGRKILRRESGIYWPRKTTRRDEQEIVAEVIVEVLQHEHVAQREIDVGFLATELIQHYGYRELRQIDRFDAMIKLIRRELDELDDEEAIMWLL